MVLPDGVAWGVLSAVVGWLIKIETQMMARPTRAELERHLKDARLANKESLEASVKPMQQQLDKIERLMENSSDQRALHNNLVGSTLAEIRTDVAVLKSDFKRKLEQDERERRDRVG